MPSGNLDIQALSKAPSHFRFYRPTIVLEKNSNYRNILDNLSDLVKEFFSEE